jgi:hypothetical protein
MLRRMFIIVPMATGYGGIKHVVVSLALVPALVDGVKYMDDPHAVPAPQTRDLRRLRQGRASSLRSLVTLAMECDSAQELGERLSRRYRRKRRIERARQAAEAEIGQD